MKSLFGNDLYDDRVFLVKPGYIGEITHAFSSLKRSSNALNGTTRWLIRIASIGAGLAAGWFASRPFCTYETAMICTVVMGILGFVITAYNTPSKFHHVFVGTEGIAEYEIDANTRKYKVLQRLRFEDASFLLKEVVEKFEKGIYQNTTYKFEWYTADGDPVFEAKSLFRRNESEYDIENKKTYYTSPRYRFLVLGELSWTNYLRKKLQEETALKTKVEYEFIVMNYKGEHQGFHYLRQHELSINTKKENIIFSKGQLKEITLQNGILEFVPADLLTQGGMKPVRCVASEIGNTQLFIELLELWLKAN